MNKHLLALIAVVYTAWPACAQQLPANQDRLGASQAAGVVSSSVERPTQKLADIRRIFVAPLGAGEGAEVIRQKVINRLVKSGVVSVVESPGDADAVLTGAAEIDGRHSIDVSDGVVSSRNRYSAEGVIRLVGRDRCIIWTDEVASSRRYFLPHRSSRGAGSDVADKIVKQLTAAITVSSIK